MEPEKFVQDIETATKEVYENTPPPEYIKQFLVSAKKVVLDESNISLEKLTSLAILFEGLYKFLSEKKIEEHYKSSLLSLRKKLWAKNFGVPTVGFLVSHLERIKNTVSCFGELSDKGFSTTPWQVNNTNTTKKDETNNVFVEPEALNKVTMPAQEENGKFIKTLNNQGYMTTQLDEYSQAFVDYAASVAKTGGKVLEIGAAYGIATLAAIAKGAQVYCNDLDPNQLAIVQQSCSPDKQSRLILVPGSFPDELDFPEKFFDAILICRVLHFFDGEKIQQAIKIAHEWLKPGGKIFVVGETPYLKNWKSFIPEFEQRKQNKQPWPGLITDTFKYEQNRSKSLPPLVHWLDQDVLGGVLTNEGKFELDKISYIDRKGQFPDDLLFDGKESVGATATKKLTPY